MTARTSRRKRTYLKQWKVPSDEPYKHPDPYTVSLTPEHELQCSCPRWIYFREQCKHIQDVLSGVYNYPDRLRPKFKFVFARVRQVELQDDRETIYLPLRPIGDTDFLATILYDCLMLGVAWKEIAEIEKARPKDGWRPLSVMYIVRTRGRKIYAKGEGYLGQHGFEYIPVE